MSGTLINVAPDLTQSILNKLDGSLGLPADAAAASDTASASLVALFKRSLQTQTGISNKLPALVNGGVPVIIAGGSSVGTCTVTTYSATTTAGNALSTNASRKRALLLNLPSNTTTVVLSFLATVTGTTGIPLSPGMGWLEDFDLIHTGVFSAIMSSGTGSLLTFEWV